MVLNVGYALLPNIVLLSTPRSLSGVGPNLRAGSVGVMFNVQERGKAQAMASFGPVLGPVFVGVMGRFIVYHAFGWRWVLVSSASSSLERHTH